MHGATARPDPAGSHSPIACAVGLCLALVVLSPVELSAGPVFSPAATETCVQDVAERSPGLSGHAVLECVGRSAQACMTHPEGDTTIGMIDCLRAENDFWDARLNAAHATLRAESERTDAEMAQWGSAAASQAQALQDMQRAWIAFRDATCLYEQSLWQGGSGAGPATMACHMHETARQALKLEGWWQQ